MAVVCLRCRWVRQRRRRHRRRRRRRRLRSRRRRVCSRRRNFRRGVWHAEVSDGVPHLKRMML